MYTITVFSVKQDSRPYSSMVWLENHKTYLFEEKVDAEAFLSLRGFTKQASGEWETEWNPDTYWIALISEVLDVTWRDDESLSFVPEEGTLGFGHAE